MCILVLATNVQCLCFNNLAVTLITKSDKKILFSFIRLKSFYVDAYEPADKSPWF